MKEQCKHCKMSESVTADPNDKEGYFITTELIEKLQMQMYEDSSLDIRCWLHDNCVNAYLCPTCKEITNLDRS
jgi:hypothetical protein